MIAALWNAVATTATLFAQTDGAAPNAGAAPPGSSPWLTVVFIFGMLGFLYVVFILPKKSQEKQMNKLIDSIKINDRVLTMSGIIGTVYSIDKQGGEIVLRVDESNNVKMRFALSSIYFVYNKEAAKEAKEAKEAKDKSAKK